MRFDEYSGLPYSDELYHHGIIGQKWGVRRFQNPDGTRTAAGKLRYATGKVGEAVGNTAKKIGRSVVKAIKKRHPSLMSDQELMEYKRRLELELSYKEAKRNLHRNDFSNRTWKAVQDIARQSATKLAVSTAEKASAEVAKKLLLNKADRERQLQLNEQKRYEQLIATDKAKRSWELKTYLDENGVPIDKSNNSNSKKKGNTKSILNDSPPIKNSSPFDDATYKAFLARDSAELERNKAEARAKADKIIEERKKTDKMIEEHRRKKAMDDYWDDLYNHSGYWSML